MTLEMDQLRLSTQVGGASSWTLCYICMCINMMMCCIANLNLIFMLVWWMLEIDLEWWIVESSFTSGIVTEPTNYTRLSKKIIHRADDLTNLSPYNPVVREITTDFKPTYTPAKIVISSAVTITSYIKVRVANTSEFKHSYYKLVSNRSSGSI
jgi:hypothetical protein